MSATVRATGFAVKSFGLGALSRTEWVVYWTAVLAPVWWLLGLQVLLYPAVVAALLVAAFGLDKLLDESPPVCVWLWLAMAIVMLWTAALGLESVGFSLRKVAAQGVTFFKSYFLIFACLALPFWSRLRVRVITRAVAWMATGYLVATALEMVLLTAGIRGGFMPPLARLIPGDVKSLQVFFAKLSPFFGLPLPRTALYTPDPPILGVCAVCCAFICLGETDRRLRSWSMAGCLCALVFCFSRSALIVLPLALLVHISFRSNLARQVSLWGTSLVSLLCGTLGLTPGQLAELPLRTFNSARAASSVDRALVVRKTLEAWQASPWVGWGIIQGSVHWHTREVALGSFSTYAAVLYLHGIVGFIVFIAALVLTLWAFYRPAVRGDSQASRAFASLIALYLLCYATPLSWMAVYLWFYFVWLGAVLQESQQHKVAESSWEQLSARHRLIGARSQTSSQESSW